MRWTNVKLIMLRELRDQFRDRRTIFMIFVLPLLLYPLLGMAFFQVSQFMRANPSKIWVLGSLDLPDEPALFENNRFAGKWFDNPARGELLQLDFATEQQLSSSATLKDVRKFAEQLLKQGEYAAVIYVPQGFVDELDRWRKESLESRANQALSDLQPVPGPEIFYTSAREKSDIAHSRLINVFVRWRDAVAKANLQVLEVSESALKPIQINMTDIAQKQQREVALWAKVLPFLLLIWALTGAFYPAVDLCAGEKERGTLETLLCSPALREEIVWGKLLTVMFFSIGTAVLNLAALGATGGFVIQNLQQYSAMQSLGLPPLSVFLWMIVALPPISALFGALCLAFAAFARSTKEGQYYLMPLLLVSMPLMMLPLAPGAELGLGNSIVPITGVLLLLRTVIEGDIARAMLFLPVVSAVTLVGCLVSIRWAVEQFNSESVLFRESERLDVRLWMRHLIRDRGELPTMGEGVLCGVLILVIQFFMSFALPVPDSFRAFLNILLVSQLVVVATPTIIMATMLTKKPWKTLRLKLPHPLAIPVAMGLAVVFHPIAMQLMAVVQHIYPMPDIHLESSFGKWLSADEHFWQILAAFAVLPAICEELAFRGFVLSGLMTRGHAWRAVLVSSVFFGITHSIVQQSIVACCLGLVLGYIAIRGGSIFPCMAFHATHNALILLISRITPESVRDTPVLKHLVSGVSKQGIEYHGYVVVVAVILTAGILVWFHKKRINPAEIESVDPLASSSNQLSAGG